jgi:hypothetical protein
LLTADGFIRLLRLPLQCEDIKQAQPAFIEKRKHASPAASAR